MKSRKPIHHVRVFAAVLLLAASVATTATAVAGEVKLTHVHGMSFSADGARLPITAPSSTGSAQWRGRAAAARSAVGSWRGCALPASAL